MLFTVFLHPPGVSDDSPGVTSPPTNIAYINACVSHGLYSTLAAVSRCFPWSEKQCITNLFIAATGAPWYTRNYEGSRWKFCGKRGRKNPHVRTFLDRFLASSYRNLSKIVITKGALCKILHIFSFIKTNNESSILGICFPIHAFLRFIFDKTLVHSSQFFFFFINVRYLARF